MPAKALHSEEEAVGRQGSGLAFKVLVFRCLGDLGSLKPLTLNPLTLNLSRYGQGIVVVLGTVSPRRDSLQDAPEASAQPLSVLQKARVSVYGLEGAQRS